MRITRKCSTATFASYMRNELIVSRGILVISLSEPECIHSSKRLFLILPKSLNV